MNVAEQYDITPGERMAALCGAAVCALLLVMCLDLVTRGRLTGWIPLASLGKPCVPCAQQQQAVPDEAA